MFYFRHLSTSSPKLELQRLCHWGIAPSTQVNAHRSDSCGDSLKDTSPSRTPAINDVCHLILIDGVWTGLPTSIHDGY
ncbi:Girdin isoform 2 [Echinococcus multilocularis]|uniref:Girdin isoform 2 n=1 Tax=Echinococcus multilocularis TaxID=6211 RepID=A0A0S4MN68_ECHMU|nr:Girdin isoform 2 [Echinococcus multilocularis]